MYVFSDNEYMPGTCIKSVYIMVWCDSNLIVTV